MVEIKKLSLGNPGLGVRAGSVEAELARKTNEVIDVLAYTIRRVHSLESLQEREEKECEEHHVKKYLCKTATHYNPNYQPEKRTNTDHGRAFLTEPNCKKEHVHSPLCYVPHSQELIERVEREAFMRGYKVGRKDLFAFDNPEKEESKEKETICPLKRHDLKYQSEEEIYCAQCLRQWRITEI